MDSGSIFTDRCRFYKLLCCKLLCYRSMGERRVLDREVPSCDYWEIRHGHRRVKILIVITCTKLTQNLRNYFIEYELTKIEINSLYFNKIKCNFSILLNFCFSWNTCFIFISFHCNHTLYIFSLHQWALPWHPL